MPRILLAVALMLTSFALPVPGQAEEVSFKAEIVPLLRRHCVSCHLTGEEQGEMALHPRAAHGSLVDVPSIEAPIDRVEPGKPEESYLYRKLTNTHEEAGGFGSPMPMETFPLDDALIEKVRLWIEQGAQDN